MTPQITSMNILCRFRWHRWTRWKMLARAGKPEDANVIVRECENCGLWQKKEIKP